MQELVDRGIPGILQDHHAEHSREQQQHFRAERLVEPEQVGFRLQTSFKRFEIEFSSRGLPRSPAEHDKQSQRQHDKENKK